MIRRKRKVSHVEVQDELNIVPILDAMIGLVIFLLFAVSSLSMKKLDLHAYGAEKVEDQVLKEQKEIEIPELKILGENNFELNKKPITSLNALYAAALEHKKKYPFNFQIQVLSKPDVELNYVAQVLSKMRTLEEKFSAKNTKGEDVEMNLLFPDAILQGAIR